MQTGIMLLLESQAIARNSAVSLLDRPDSDQPTKIHVGLFLIDILSINNADQTFTADFRLQLWWNDPRLASNTLGKYRTQRKINLDGIWNPPIRFLNSRKLKKQFDDTLEITDKGLVTHTQRYIGDFSVKLALRNFPTDKQKLSIVMTSGSHSPKEIDFVFDPKWSGQSDVFSIVEWSVHPIEAHEETIDFSSFDSSQIKRIASITIQCPVSRRSGYFLWKVIVPLSLIVFMSWSAFWIDPSELSPQVEVSTASVLTLIAFQFSLGYVLPRISYLTRMDFFVLLSTIIVFLALAESILTSYLSKRKRGKTARRIDLWSRILFPFSFTILVLVSFVF
jgi:hypothetical protein